MKKNIKKPGLWNWLFKIQCRQEWGEFLMDAKAHKYFEDYDDDYEEI